MAMRRGRSRAAPAGDAVSYEAGAAEASPAS